MDNLKIITYRATEVLGSKDQATDWINKKSKTLGGSPKDICKTTDGLNKVLFHLRGIECFRQS